MAKFEKQDKQNLTSPIMPYHLENIENALITLNKAFVGASYNNSVLKLTRMDGSSISFDLTTSGGSETEEGIAHSLVQGAWVADGYSSNHSNRVCTSELIEGAFTVTTNEGYVIRAVYAYPASTGGAATMVAETSTTRTEFTSTDASLFYGVTFAKVDATASISPDEDIVAEWKAV